MTNRILVALAFYGAAVAAPFASSPQTSSVTVGSASAAAGQTAYGAIQVPKGTDDGTALSVAVINGAKPGKRIAFIAGSHGTEYTSIVALTRLIGKIDPKTLTGTVVVAPLLNVASFEQMTVHVNPVDKKGMNAGYPGDAAGTQTDRALALVAAQIVNPSDVIVDLHGGDLDENLRPYSYWIRTGNQVQDDGALKLVSAFGLDHVIVRDIDAMNPASTRSLSGYALGKGKVALVAEAGRSGIVTDADVNALVNGCLNVLSSLKAIVRPTPPAVKMTYVSGGSRVVADKQGMFFATASRDQIVAEGVVLGYTTDYLGRKIGDVKSPVAGLVTFIRGVPSTWPNATLANVSPILSSPPPPYKKPS